MGESNNKLIDLQTEALTKKISLEDRSISKISSAPENILLVFKSLSDFERFTSSAIYSLNLIYTLLDSMTQDDTIKQEFGTVSI